MTVFKICAFGILLAVVAFSLRNLGWRGVPLFAVIGGLSLLSLLSDTATQALAVFDRLSQIDGLSSGVSTVLRILGVGYLSGFTSDVCVELGEIGISKAVGVAGKLFILAAVMPYLSSLLDAGIALVS